MSFVKATKKQAKLRLALEAPAGYGKSYTGLAVATYLAKQQGKRIAALDTEAKSLSKYADLFDFDVIEAEPPFHPHKVIEAIGDAVNGDYGVFLVDSLSHFWAGDGGLLDIVDTVARTKYRGDSHRAWKEGGEIQQELTDSILRSPIHIIAAMRTKKDYVRSTDENGKTKIRAAGTKTIQRDEFDYEFDIVGRFEVPTVLTIIKSRCATLPPDTVVDKPGADFAATLSAWLDAGEVVQLATDDQKKTIEALAAECAKLAGKKKSEVLARIPIAVLTETDAVATLDKLGEWKTSLVAQNENGTAKSGAAAKAEEAAVA